MTGVAASLITELIRAANSKETLPPSDLVVLLGRAYVQLLDVATAQQGNEKAAVAMSNFQLYSTDKFPSDTDISKLLLDAAAALRNVRIRDVQSDDL